MPIKIMRRLMERMMRMMRMLMRMMYIVLFPPPSFSWTYRAIGS